MLKGYFLPCTTLYLTNEYFYGGLIQNYLSLEDLQILFHNCYRRFLELFKRSLMFFYVLNSNTCKLLLMPWVFFKRFWNVSESIHQILSFDQWYFLRVFGNSFPKFLSILLLQTLLHACDQITKSGIYFNSVLCNCCQTIQ